MSARHERDWFEWGRARSGTAPHGSTDLHKRHYHVAIDGMSRGYPQTETPLKDSPVTSSSATQFDRPVWGLTSDADADHPGLTCERTKPCKPV